MNDAADKALATRLSQALGSSYTLDGEIGRGGMGVVFKARDERLKRQVAVKVLPPELAFREEIRIRFLREAETAARLSHPHIVPIHSVGEGPDGLVYFVMAYVDGESLAAKLKRRGRLPSDEARRVMQETADALGAAHALGIIHRDVKPDNILLEGSRGRVVVTDFGIAKALSSTTGGATLTGTGVAIGTPHYMSPEQAAGDREIDGRSDVYSLGVVAYQMLVGELPFHAPTVPGILMKHITERAPMITDKRPELPEDLAACVMRSLEKDPEDRWPTADALRRALEARSATMHKPRRSSGPSPSRGVRAPPLPAQPPSRGRGAGGAGGAGGMGEAGAAGSARGAGGGGGGGGRARSARPAARPDARPTDPRAQRRTRDRARAAEPVRHVGFSVRLAVHHRRRYGQPHPGLVALRRGDLGRHHAGPPLHTAVACRLFVARRLRPAAGPRRDRGALSGRGQSPGRAAARDDRRVRRPRRADPAGPQRSQGHPADRRSPPQVGAEAPARRGRDGGRTVESSRRTGPDAACHERERGPGRIEPPRGKDPGDQASGGQHGAGSANGPARAPAPGAHRPPDPASAGRGPARVVRAGDAKRPVRPAAAPLRRRGGGARRSHPGHTASSCAGARR